MKHPIQLFKISKGGKVLSFLIEVYEACNKGLPCLRTEKGFTDGIKQTDEKVFQEGKNLGRANQTSPLEQALSEAKSIKNKLLDKGYKEWTGGPIGTYSQSELINFLRNKGEGTDASGNLKPMLAQKDPKKVVFPCYIQKKYDGIRCFTFIQGGKITKRSRNGKLFEHLDHLDADIARFNQVYPGDWILDGELYSSQLTFQNIVSSVKRAQASNKLIGYRVYDVIPFHDMGRLQSQRMTFIKNVRASDFYEELDHIEFAPTWTVNCWDEVKEKFAKFIDQGFEGAMLRHPKYKYEFGHRSYGLIKYKEYHEDEFEVIDIEEATGRDAGTAVFVLRREEVDHDLGTYREIEFRARPMGSRELREDYLINKDKYIGQMATVKYQELTDDGVPRFPVMKAIRNYE